jgi:(1->4)-alpha-D-glucan 1-alpha-D-glucosylmutase
VSEQSVPLRDAAREPAARAPAPAEAALDLGDRAGRLRATYRVQLRPDSFTLHDAAAAVDYLNRLGVSHLYASPYLQAAPGSLHGYDVVDYRQVNRELGGVTAQRKLVKTLQRAGMGQVLDIVPNHMATHPKNPWWWDVLENGPSSRYASHFDLDWDSTDPRYDDVLVVPVLGDHYGRVIESGELQVHFEDGRFTVRYHDHIYPVDPHTLGGILSAAAEQTRSDELAFLAGAHEGLPASEAADRASANRRYRDKEVLRAMLDALARQNLEVRKAIRQVVEVVNSDPDALDVFLSRQNYRPALWKISASELGYRRFFDINTLIGVRVEDEQVYRDTHGLVLEWAEEGVLDGLRIDHPDGLRDPRGYFERLRGDAPGAWIVVEKILEAEERLPETWPVHGTTGYDFIQRVNGLFVARENEAALTEFYTAFTGREVEYPVLALEKKRLAAYQVLGSDLSRLTDLFRQVCERNRRYRDYTRDELQDTLAEVAACLPVYRAYIRPAENEVSETDRAHIHQAVEAAKANRPDLDPRLLDFFRDMLLLEARGPVEDDLVERFQQFTGPVMAKGVEDTTFYVYNRFISLNEVGGNPGCFGVTPAEFHQACQETQARWPHSLLASSTHDTKRSEDVRARLNVLSEIPVAWKEAVRRWADINEPLRGPAPADAGGSGEKWPDRNAEYLLYQTLVGAWPLSAERAVQYMEKAVREAKEYTTWTAPNAAYETAVTDFVRGILADARFTADLEAFVARLVEPGRINSLSQALLKLTTPGIPDLYQGTELWSLALVDPDNRQPVDYELRRRLLDRLEHQPTPEEVWTGVEEGLPKLWVIRQALDLRRRRPELFGAQGSYTAMEVEEDAAVAFQRGDIVVVAPRKVVSCRPRWGSYHVTIPQGLWHNLLTGEQVRGGSLSLGDLLARFPVALMEREN